MSPLHHIAIEVDERLIAAERTFWGILGYNSTRPQSSGSTPSHWLINSTGGAIHLLPIEVATVPELGHLALVDDQLERVGARLQSFGFSVRKLQPYLGADRLVTVSPSGHLIELMSKRVAVKAGPPTTTPERTKHDRP